MRTLFFDIDTQIDFIFPSGALYAPGAEKILPTVARLNHHAAKHRIPVISTMDAHSENDAEFVQWPHHCVVDTFGQRKPASTLLENRVIVPNSPSAVPGRISRPGSIISVSRSLWRIHSLSAGSFLCGSEAWQKPE